MKRSIFVLLLTLGALVHADMDNATRWVDQEFQPSTLSRDQQLEEIMKQLNDREQRIQGHLAVAQQALTRAHAMNEAVMDLRAKAFARFDANDDTQGEALWAEAVETSVTLRQTLRQAVSAAESALVLGLPSASHRPSGLRAPSWNPGFS